MKWVYLLIAILGETIATTALKASEGFTQILPSIVVVIGYCIAFYFMSLTLKSIPIGVSYAIWSGVGIVLIALMGYVFYKQTLDLASIIGISLILAGVLVIRIFSKSSA